MNLRRLAESDLARIVEDTTLGGWPVTVTSPQGVVVPLVGVTNDIATAIDPETGQLVAGRTVSVSLRISSLTAAAFGGEGLPRAIASESSKPWLISFEDLEGNAQKFAVKESFPDRGMGLLTCVLGGYRDGA